MAEEAKVFDFKGGEILVFDKPLEWTSFDLVQKVRNNLCRKMHIKKLKVGHAGTLDPMATGVMVLCTGKATKRIEELQAGEKEYIATLKLGATTPSFDRETNEDATFDTGHITEELFRETVQKFIGTIAQVPPEYSAVKVEGQRAYELARKGQTVELKPKILVVKEIDVLQFAMPEAKLRIVCGKGTYIRALARDIGQALNCGAYLTGLQRTRVGDFKLGNAKQIDEFLESLKDMAIAEE
ncbi:tRNA pseudouridine(55) synthase TruB [Prolixibacter sp. SD074]|jgi:tRNA pseudouridine55 synthase|uniref:tRNA pseudouridine(55) synthase TruB n=1 Tax=Prolixibacter sp. SD074 TaxID=2652391 RepID=UPI001281FC81|nr:tRNA pseudouridine(55) synthase TruB [Prolixibacter sp. SD074]GET30616.1 tRNA pseudouridine synthase B [Prolixibacter sp. SD074]